MKLGTKYFVAQEFDFNSSMWPGYIFKSNIILCNTLLCYCSWMNIHTVFIILYHIYYSHSWSLLWHWPSFMKDKIIAITKWKWESPLAWLCLTSHPNLSMVDCISKTRMPLFVDKRVSVGGHLVFSCQFYVGLWCKDYDQNKNNCGHEHCTNIVPKCYCGDKGLVISFPARPRLHVATLYRAMIQTPYNPLIA